LRLILMSELEVGERQRSIIGTAELSDLKESILSSKGLLHPIVVWHDAQTKTYKLVAGERRRQAIELLYKDNKTFKHDGLMVPQGAIPAVLVDELSPADLLETEIEENLIREDFSWQDRIKALAALHKQRQSENPSQTITDTSKELAEKSGRPTPVGFRKELSRALVIAERLGDEKISKARNANEAHFLVLKQEEETLRALLNKRKTERGGSGAADIKVRYGDMFEVLPLLEEGTVDLILTDPPYGVDAGGGGFRGRTVIHHNYVDTPEEALKIATTIFDEGFRITKSRANIFMFCSVKMWHKLTEIASRTGWEPFPFPIIWQKSESEGLAPWGRQGFRHVYEAVLYATKGAKGLISSPIDLLNVRRVSRQDRTHAAEKPVDLLGQLIECSTLVGDLVLDPCCGSGSTLIAARNLRRKGIGIEKDESFYNTAMSNLYQGEDSEASLLPSDSGGGVVESSTGREE